MSHIVWDWNGTLYDDLHLLAECSSLALQAVGGRTISIEDYKRLHTRPLSSFYERVAERKLTDNEWQVINESFHSTYEAMLHEADLAVDARTALETVHTYGSSQSLLSMWVHDALVPLTAAKHVDHYFTRVDGLETAGGESKEFYLQRHLSRLENQLGTTTPLDSITMIGDTVDDGNAAHAVGVNCVLVSTGAQLASDLEQVGWPVADSLTNAVAIALRL